VIQVDVLEVRDKLTIETWLVRIEDREVMRLTGKIDRFGESDLVWTSQ